MFSLQQLRRQNGAALSRVARWYKKLHTKLPILVRYEGLLEYKLSVYFIAIYNILQLIGIFYGH
jgi:hypothetical protein